MRKFSLAQMEALLAIARLGTFHAAAKQINVTQPTISLRIRELESAIGAELFERDGRLARLTAQGVIAVRYAEQALGLFDELETRLRTGDPLQGTLRLGASEMVAMTCLPEIITLLEDTYPHLRVELTVANSFVLCDLLNANRLDIAFLADPGISGKVRFEPLALANVAWLSGAARTLPTTLLRPRDLAGVNILSVPPPSPLHEIVAAWCASEKAPAPEFSTCNSVAMIARLVANGVAMSVLPVCVLHDELARGTVVAYRQRFEFKPLRVSAAYQRGLERAGIDAVVRIARIVMQKSDHFLPLQA